MSIEIEPDSRDGGRQHAACRTPKFKRGDYIVITDKAGTLFRVTTPGTLCYVVASFAPQKCPGCRYGLRFSGDPIPCNEKVNIKVIPLKDDNVSGASWEINDYYAKLAKPKEIKEKAKAVSDLRNAVGGGKALRTGDPIEFSMDVEVPGHGFMGSGKMVIRKGTPAIIEAAPGSDTSAEEASNAAGDEIQGIKLSDVNDLTDTNFGFKLRDYIPPRICVYLPEMELEEWVPIGSIKIRPPRLHDVQLVVPPDYVERIVTATKRVTNKKVHDFIYEKLGLHHVCQKGRGTIILMYGPPGTGKTMTAEVMAERIGRPLIRLTLGSLNDSEGLKKKLGKAFERARRYRAVLLLDEVDVLIRKRGGHNPIFDENTSVFLRVLEYYDGILMMTTNMMDHIDPAIFSRVHLCLEYGAATEKERAEIWSGMLPKELRACIRGNEEEHDRMIAELGKIPINGREIKTVVQNAVGRAAASLVKDGELKEMPTAKWIPTGYFLSEATQLYDQRQSMSGKVA